MVIEKDALVAGRYRLIEQVGSGAMGVVWKAHDERLGRTVAIKRLIVRYGLSDAMTEEVRKRAMREARIAARLQHRNAIALFDVAEDKGDPILVMEFLPSKSLSAVLEERGTLTPAEAAEIGAQVAAAIAAAHAVGIAHRDIKPGNILLAENGTVKITDFGVSRAIDDGTITTQTGMLAGTPAYLAPEIARGDEPSRASDVFSLGSTLYHSLEGRPPFGTNSNPLALLHAVASGHVPPPRNAGTLEPTLMSLMRVDPSERPTMTEVAESLAALATVEMSVPSSAATKVATPPRPVLAAQAKTPPAPPTVPTSIPAPTAAFRKSEQTTTRSGPSKRNMAIVGVVALLVMAGTLVTVLLLNNGGGNSGDNNAQGGDGPTTTTQQAGQEPPDGNTDEEPPPSSEKEDPPSSQPSSAPDDAGANPTTVAPPAGTTIQFSPAGNFVIRYFGDSTSLGERWSMLSPFGQALFGSQDAFNQYWSQFTNVSSKNAQGLSWNADGSVNVPCDVTYTTAAGPNTQHKNIRVTMINNQMVIDSDAR